MKTSAFLFRYRMVINMLIIVLGFWAPWIQYLGLGSRILLLEWLALEISRTGLLSFTVATPVLIIFAALVAAIGAVLRIWGAAWLGHGVVFDAQMQAGALTADGPFRYVRNPLYLGIGCMFAALALIMPASGALFVLIAAPLFLFSLIRGEEAYLTAEFGDSYRAYLLAVPRLIPRLIPRLRTTVAPSGSKPHWLQAMLSEINPIGVFITIAFLSWTYDTQLMLRAIAITFGASLIVRAFMPGLKQTTNSPE
jgi:protein-S-isoprenylcysteine O-methyltransferase Ste14